MTQSPANPATTVKTGKASASVLPSRIYRVCLQCSSVFSFGPWKLKRGDVLFCSRECNYAYKTAKSVAKLVSRTCPECSKSFKVLPWRVERGGEICCSRECVIAYRTEKPESKFWKHVNKTEDCWLWTGGQIKGYGQISTPEKKYAHRFSWEIHSGAIPVGLCVLHKCDVPLCVRPDHLFLGTDKDNTKDRIEKGRGNVRLIMAFGETKYLSEWLRDIRCLGTYSSVIKRIERGFSPEFALTTEPLTNFEAGLCRAIALRI